jgi:CBS domain containing-hemolysin-like protein
MPAGTLLGLVGLAVLLAFSAFFSGSETALFSLSRVQVHRLREKGGRTGRAVARLLALPRRLLITILFGNLVVNTALGSIIAAFVTERLGHKGVGLAIATTTLLLLVFGEVTPKTFAVRHAEAVARGVAFPLLWFSRVIFPFRCLLRYLSGGVLFLLRQGRIESEDLLTRGEFAAALETGEEEGTIDEHERAMVERISELRHMAARELMVPRTEIVSVGEDVTIQEALRIARRSGHSRLPVHSGDLDAIWGILDIRDLPAWRDEEVWDLTIRDFVEMSKAAGAPRRPFVRPAYLVPETRRVGDLLRDMRQSGTHLAILLDEFGGTAGLVTLRQLTDELVGGVVAKERLGAPLYQKTDDTIRVLGEARIRDLNRELGLALPLDPADTVGGYVLSLFGDLPMPGDEVCDQRFTYKVLRLSRRRVAAVEMRPLEASAPPAEADPWAEGPP